MSKKNSIIDMLTFGFALFAMFFGAGNLIFPHIWEFFPVVHGL